MTITRTFRTVLGLAIVAAPLALIGCDSTPSGSTTPSTGTPSSAPPHPGPVTKGTDVGKEIPKPGAPAPDAKKP